MRKKVLVTGAGGFLGTHLSEVFHRRGYQTIGWDIKDCASQSVKRVDMLDFNSVVQELAEYEPDIVIHCAGLADVALSVKDPLGDYNSNVTTTRFLFEAILTAKIRYPRVIFVSSAAVYGNPDSLPVNEEAPLLPLSPYALHKVMCEEICRYYIENYDMDIRIVRIFSAYGIGLKKQIFWDMYHKIKTEGCLHLYGKGDESRDYIYIDDLLQAIYLVVTTEACEKIINVANGKEITIRHAAESFIKSCGISDDKIIFSGQDMAGVPKNWKADITKLKGMGYQQQVSFEEGVKKYIAWVDNETVVAGNPAQVVKK